ncbi:hypothetical protein NP493_216g03017 [Ridgeia piscesae]|uniref:Uncharacterized protein n=1 Tax=Ridgeia piscesae TaxID=27915 RepID=A0AAD9UE64_RIDPI|nr:hypothetical protein NP493_216g03017 [Ridgeia piscesae]
MIKYRGGWPRLVHLSADYVRDSGTTTMCPCGLKARYAVQSCCPPFYTGPMPGQCTREKAACLHDTTSAFDHEDNLDGQSDKQGILERTGLPSMEDILIRKNLWWTGHLMRMSPDRLPKQILYSQLSSGHRKSGRPGLRFKDNIKEKLNLRDIKTDSWT